MKIQKRYLFIIFGIVFLGIGMQTFQYVKTFKEEVVSAVALGTPNPGHSLSQLECSADSLCIDITHNYVGIGTNNPSQKLEVNGNIKLGGASPTYKITNLAAPVSSGDAATKAYVDAAGSSLYSACYVINSATAGLTCDAGYANVLSVVNNCWTGAAPFGGNASLVSFGLGGNFTVGTCWNVDGLCAAPTSPIYSYGTYGACLSATPGGTCNGYSSRCYPVMVIQGINYASAVAYNAARTFSLCCK